MQSEVSRHLIGATKGIPNAWQANFDNVFNNARQVYQDPQLTGSGTIVTSQSSALANRTSINSAVTLYGNNATDTFVLTNTASNEVSQANQPTNSYSE